MKISSGESYPFLMHVQDQDHHIKSLVENKKCIERVNSLGKSDTHSFRVTLNTRDEFLSVFKYKCTSELRPVPIVSKFI